MPQCRARACTRPSTSIFLREIRCPTACANFPAPRPARASPASPARTLWNRSSTAGLRHPSTKRRHGSGISPALNDAWAIFPRGTERCGKRPTKIAYATTPSAYTSLACGRRTAIKKFRGHETGRPGYPIRGERGVVAQGGPRQAKVRHPGKHLFARASHHDVRGLDIPMQDSRIVRGRNSRTHLPQNAKRLFARQRTVAGKPRRQALTRQQLHGQVGELPLRPLPVPKIVHRTKIWVNHSASTQNFPLESLAHDGVSRILGENRLERHVSPAQVAILHLINLAHPAARQESNHREAVVDQVANFELWHVCRRGRVSAPGAPRTVSAVSASDSFKPSRAAGANVPSVPLWKSSISLQRTCQTRKSADTRTESKLDLGGEANPCVSLCRMSLSRNL